MAVDHGKISKEDKERLREEIFLIDRVAKGKFRVSRMPKNIYQVKHNANSYIEFQMEKSRFTIGKFQKELKKSKK